MQNENSEVNTNEEDEAFLAEMRGETYQPEVDVKTPVEEEEAPEAVEDVSDETVEEQEPEEGDDSKETSEPVIDERVEVIPGFTAEELKVQLGEIPKLRKALETTNGTYGQRLADQQKALDELKKSFTPRKLDKVRENFPELADLLEQDGFASPDAEEAAKPEFDAGALREELNAEMEKKLAEVKLQAEIKQLTQTHPDWQEVATYNPVDGMAVWNNKEFGQWINTKGSDVIQTLIKGEDATAISKIITDYKNSKKPKLNTTLTKAITPKGTVKSSIPKSDGLSEEERAFREEMKRL